MDERQQWRKMLRYLAISLCGGTKGVCRHINTPTLQARVENNRLWVSQRVTRNGEDTCRVILAQGSAYDEWSGMVEMQEFGDFVRHMGLLDLHLLRRNFAWEARNLGPFGAFSFPFDSGRHDNLHVSAKTEMGKFQKRQLSSVNQKLVEYMVGDDGRWTCKPAGFPREFTPHGMLAYMVLKFTSTWGDNSSALEKTCTKKKVQYYQRVESEIFVGQNIKYDRILGL
ncbi:hypothetical protein MTR_2g032040 [Medicago truncatula]|uniref:Uncharacterized protein n=1 Tax=Medicago truncatula TaxID=3880 RepID=A0A072V672_MEDTR|nr:hypothetical protein MTR_2g032040 [Medicago truncatula]